MIFYKLPKDLLSVVLPTKLHRIIDVAKYNDVNALQRLEMDREALHILRDNLFAGNGGGDWSRLYLQYQPVYFVANETHNHYLQVAVETGIWGLLSFIAFWVIMISGARNKQSSVMTRVWAVAAIAIGIHSVIDFDLSYYSMILLILVASGIVASNQPAFSWARSRYWIGTLVLAAAIFLLALPQAIGDVYFQLGKSSMAQKQSDAAANYFTKAASFLPLDPQPHAELSLVKLGTDDQIRHLRTAERLDPYNPQWPYELSVAFEKRKDLQSAFASSLSAVRLQPSRSDYYEMALDTGVQLFIKYFEENGKGSAQVYNSLLGLVDQLQKANESADSFKHLGEAHLKHTPLMEIRRGQALALAGKYEEALAALKSSRRNVFLIPESEIWMYLIYQKQDNQVKQAELNKQPWIRFLPNNPISKILSSSELIS